MAHVRISKERQAARVRIAHAKLAVFEALETVEGLTDAEQTLALSEIISNAANNRVIEETP